MYLVSLLESRSGVWRYKKLKPKSAMLEIIRARIRKRVSCFVQVQWRKRGCASCGELRAFGQRFDSGVPHR